ncbi:hypothetical protein ACMD2_17702 [Ananas comosus]|nr:hypothetical protein ACMD2_17702 [Ananas comosus]
MSPAMLWLLLSSLLAVAVVTIPCFAAAAADTAPPYANHTVGGAAGWFFNATANASATNYSAWAATQSFYLGDYLIFNTNANSTVVQTSNETAYQLCDASGGDDGDGGGGDDTFFFSGGGGGRGGGAEEAVAVPLTVEGALYYFSDDDDGIQCARGMRFAVAVARGRGLPPALAAPPPPPPPSAAPPPPYTAAGTSQGERFYNGAGRLGLGLGFWGSVAGVGVVAAMVIGAV